MKKLKILPSFFSQTKEVFFCPSCRVLGPPKDVPVVSPGPTGTHGSKTSWASGPGSWQPLWSVVPLLAKGQEHHTEPATSPGTICCIVTQYFINAAVTIQQLSKFLWYWALLKYGIILSVIFSYSSNPCGIDSLVKENDLGLQGTLLKNLYKLFEILKNPPPSSCYSTARPHKNIAVWRGAATHN